MCQGVCRVLELRERRKEGNEGESKVGWSSGSCEEKVLPPVRRHRRQWQQLQEEGRRATDGRGARRAITSSVAFSVAFLLCFIYSPVLFVEPFMTKVCFRIAPPHPPHRPRRVVLHLFRRPASLHSFTGSVALRWQRHATLGRPPPTLRSSQRRRLRVSPRVCSFPFVTDECRCEHSVEPLERRPGLQARVSSEGGNRTRLEGSPGREKMACCVLRLILGGGGGGPVMSRLSLVSIPTLVHISPDSEQRGGGKHLW